MPMLIFFTFLKGRNSIWLEIFLNLILKMGKCGPQNRLIPSADNTSCQNDPLVLTFSFRFNVRKIQIQFFASLS